MKSDRTVNAEACVCASVCFTPEYLPASLPDNMIFNSTAHNVSLLRCEVNVTDDPRLVLSISQNGDRLRSNASARGYAERAPPFVTLSETVPLSIHGEYVCELRLNRDLITKSIFHQPPPGKDL